MKCRDISRLNPLLKLFILMVCYVSSNAMEFLLDLKMPRFVIVGQSARLRCEYSVRPDELSRVEWQRAGSKIFRYIKGRVPPFTNYSIVGAQLDWAHSNETQITLKNMSFEASGSYCCQVSTQTPIYTKASNDEELTVIQPQREPPVISVLQPQYEVGELLSVNCTSSPSRPAAHVTWLINDKPVSEGSLRLFSGRHHGDHHMSTTTVQLSMMTSEDHVGPGGTLELTCLATIPAYRGDDHEYADRRTHSTSVDVVMPPPPQVSSISSQPEQSRLDTRVFSILLLVLVSSLL